jgi:hypothetical protein
MRPLDRIQAGRVAAAVGEHFPLAGRDLLGVDRHHDALRAVLLRGVVHQLRVGHGRGVHADLVGAGIQQAPHILDLAHAAAHGQRDEDGRGHGFDDRQDQVAAVAGGGDVEEGDLVGALLVIAARDFDRVAGVAQLGEIDALDHAAAGDVQAGDDAFCEHRI